MIDGLLAENLALGSERAHREESREQAPRLQSVLLVVIPVLVIFQIIITAVLAA